MKRPEQLLQQGVFKFLTPLMVMQKYQQFIAFQIKNETGVGGRQGQIIGSIAKSMGTMSGVSDTAILLPKTARECVDIENPINDANGVFYPTTRLNIPPKIVFVEIKALKPLKTKPVNPIDLLSPTQKLFKERVEFMGFEYRIVAAENVNDAVNQYAEILRKNGVSV